MYIYDESALSDITSVVFNTTFLSSSSFNPEYITPDSRLPSLTLPQRSDLSIPTQSHSGRKKPLKMSDHQSHHHFSVFPTKTSQIQIYRRFHRQVILRHKNWRQ